MGRSRPGLSSPPAGPTSEHRPEGVDGPRVRARAREEGPAVPTSVRPRDQAPNSMNTSTGWVASHTFLLRVARAREDELGFSRGRGDRPRRPPTTPRKAAGNPFAYVDTSNNTQIVLYRSADGGIHCPYWSTAEARHEELSPAGAPRLKATPSAGSGERTAFTTSSTELVMATSMCSGGPVQMPPPTSNLSASAPPAVGDISGYRDPVRGDNIVFYRSADGHITPTPAKRSSRAADAPADGVACRYPKGVGGTSPGTDPLALCSPKKLGESSGRDAKVEKPLAGRRPGPR